MVRKTAGQSEQAKQDVDDDDDPVPTDPDEFRWALVRRIQNFLGAWRDCDDRGCKRARACRGRPLFCMRDRPALTRKKTARVRANMLRALKRAAAKAEAQPAAGAAAGQRVTRVTR